MIFDSKVSPRPPGFKPRQRQPQSQTRNLTRRELLAAIRNPANASTNKGKARSEQHDDQRSGRSFSGHGSSEQAGGHHAR